jgi:hypothetical protein
MPARRPLLTALTGAALLLSLAGCQKPSPSVTLVSAGKSVHSEAHQYCRDGKFLTKANGNECPAAGKPVTVLSADQDGLVGVDVAKQLTETGWYLFDLDAQRSYGFQDKHYLSIVADYSNRPVPGVIHLEVRQVDRKPRNDRDLPKVVGQWKFELVQKS